MAGKKDKYVFTWKIENFSLCGLKCGERLESPIFKTENIGGSKWGLTLYPKGFDKTFKNSVSIFLHKVEDIDGKSVDFTLELLDCDSKILISRSRENEVIDDDGFGFFNFFYADKINEKIENWKDDTLTIRCDIIGDSVDVNNPVRESIAWTKIGFDRCFFKWNVGIPGSASWNKKRDVFISEKSQLSITLTSPADNIEIDIRNVDEDESQSKLVTCKISLITLNGVEIKSKRAKYLFGENGDRENWEFPSFFSKNYLRSKTHDLMQNSTYTLKFEIFSSNGDIMSEIKINSYADPLNLNTPLDDSISILQEDLRKLLKDDKSSDVKLQVEDMLIPANKAILRARSPVFSAMFDQDMLENQTGVVKIGEDAETMNCLLEFVYTGSVNELSYGGAKKLIVAADKYLIPSLTNKCSFFLESQLSAENVCDVCALADMINLDKLKLSALEFIKKNSKEVILSNVWSDWMRENVILANEILFRYARDSLE